MSQAVDYKCPQCGGSLVYDATRGAMVCGNCGSSFDPAQFQAAGWERAAAAQPAAPPAPPPAPEGWPPAEAGPDPLAGMVEYTCSSCGATVMTDPTSAAGSCPYCRSPIVVAAQVSGQLAPDLVIPFRFTRDQAVEALNKLYRGKRLLPKVFASQNFVDEVKGVYVPFWLYDFDARVSEQYTATNTSTRHAGSKRYTTTYTYSAVREGLANFRAIPVDGSANMPDVIMESIEPYEVSEAVAFGPSYLAGFLAERYDVDSKQAYPRARERLEQTGGTVFKSTVTGYQTVRAAASQVTPTREEVRYGLLPVWMLTTIWRGERFTFAMNGQTGRIVGDLPLDKGAYWRWMGGLAGISAVIGGGVALLVAIL